MNAPERLGPYAILGEIGRGGGGVVYRARHAGGRLVALKSLPAPSDDGLVAIRREIYALQRIRHPGIVTILDSGLEAGLPWLAMELLEGPTLGERCRALWDAGAPDGERLGDVLSLFRRLCAPLGYLHGEGIVHRDLKPRNVLVRAGDWPVIVDFGLVLSAPAPGREPLATGGHAGTAAFMAPEQVRGEPVDPRADLFSLGAMLCLVLGGAPPFETLADVTDAGVSPQLPSARVAGLPGDLDALVARLLARDPRERLGHADDVAAALGRLGARNGSAGPRPRAYVYRPAFVGRDDLMRALAAHVVSVGGGGHRLVLVGGESGMGKTRLCAEVGREVARRGTILHAGECAAGRTLSLGPLRPLLQRVAEACRAAGDGESERVLGDDGPLLALHEPALAALPAVARRPAPPDVASAEARRRLHRALDGVLTRSGAAAGLLVLDDLQWADDLTLGYLEHLASLTHDRRPPIAILGNYRTELVPEPLRRVATMSGVDHMLLGRLDDADVARLVADMLAVPSPWPGLVGFVARQSHGNPFFVAEYLRAAIGAGMLVRDDEGRWRLADGPGRGLDPLREETFAALGLPGALRDLVALRMEGLSPAARQLLDAASVLGRDVETELALAVALLDGEASLEALHELGARQVTEPSAPLRLRLAHEQLRAVAYDAIEADRRRELHLRAAGALEERGGDAGELQAALADHLDRGGRPDLALPRYRRAASFAVSRYSTATQSGSSPGTSRSRRARPRSASRPCSSSVPRSTCAPAARRPPSRPSRRRCARPRSSETTASGAAPTSASPGHTGGRGGSRRRGGRGRRRGGSRRRTAGTTTLRSPATWRSSTTTRATRSGRGSSTARPSRSTGPREAARARG